MSKTKEQMQDIAKKLFWKQLRRFISISVLLTGGVLLLGVAIRWKAHQTIWHGNEMMWIMWSWIRKNWTASIVIVVMASALLAAFFALKTSYTYLEQVLEAAQTIYMKEENTIKLPEELREAEVQLNDVKQQLERNERAAKEAEQRKNDLIVYLAHDLKTPLTSVIGYLTLLRDEGQISEELRTKYLSISLEKAEHLEDLINEFFEITRFNLSTLTLEPSRVNLTRMLEQITYEFKPMLDEKELVCTLDAPKDLQVKWDVGKMQRVFDNLLRNAVNYSFEGGEIVFSVEEKDSDIEMVCMNQGNTIPEEKLSRIFEQFFRLDSARTTRSGGAGLGLAIAKEIVELHGGTICAESENEEIRFLIKIPKEV